MDDIATAADGVFEDLVAAFTVHLGHKAHAAGVPFQVHAVKGAFVRNRFVVIRMLGHRAT